MSSETVTVIEVYASRRLNDHGAESDKLIAVLHERLKATVDTFTGQLEHADLDVWVY